MNQIYRVIWNCDCGRWVVVSESVAAHGKAHSHATAMPVQRASAQMAHGISLRPLPWLLLGVGLSLASLSALAQPPAATALPTGGVVSAGQATISQSGSQMQIVQGSDKAALNWQSFNIGASAGVTFQQPSSQSVALNRVTGADPSQIFGTLNANGKLILINPNGVVFGQGSRVDAAGLIATTKALSDADFMNGNYHFAGGGSGVVRNDGTLVAAPDGKILLVADKVINTGTMQVRGGTIGMVSADELRVSGDWQTATVTGAAAMNLSDVTVENLGRIDVSGLQGGQISLKGGNGTTQSGGELLAAGEQGRGGGIHLSGMRVGLLRGSLTDASGASGGGDVLVGGDWQGGGSMEHASATYMDADAVIRVNATGQGDGGKAVLWSDGYTNFRGQIQANGAGTGNGGQVETSGKDILDAIGSVTARGVQAGDWLLDPANVTISATGPGSLNSGVYVPGSGQISSAIINDALDNDTNVTIATTPGTGGVGHLIQNADADIIKSTPGEATLSLIADLDLVLNGNITAADGKLNVWLSASGAADNGSGAILVNQNITTNGGTLDFRSGVYTGGTSAQTFTTAGGAVTFKSDLLIVDGLTINTTGPAGVNGAVTFNGKIDSGDRYSFEPTKTTWTQAEINARGMTGGGSADNDTYLATPLSELQNLVAAREANFVEAWLGGRRTGSNWRWVGGIKKDQIFFTSSTATTNPAASPLYTNWQTGEPNNAGNAENVLQFVGLAGKWNDLATSQTYGYVIQTNRPASPLTVNAGTATVTFGGAVGSLKPLENLVVTGPTVINGGQIRTEAGQTYNDPVTIGSGPTLLESTESSLHLITPMTFNQPAASALTIKAAQDIVLDTPITATNGDVSVTMLADSANTGTGSITLNKPIMTRGGAIDLTASSGILLNSEILDTTGGATPGSITLTNAASGSIIAMAGATMTTDSGDISVTNNAATGGRVSLQDLTGGAVTIVNKATDVGAGQNAVTLNRPVSGNGAITISSMTGDILIDGNIINAGMPVNIVANVADTGVGAIVMNAPVTTSGGAISLTANSGITLNHALDSNGSGVGEITLINKASGDINALVQGTINAGSDAINVINNAVTGGRIALQDLAGGAITVANNATDAAAGQNAVTLNGEVTGSGSVSVTSRTGDIEVRKDISSSAENDTSAIIIGASTASTAMDLTGGDVKLTGASRLVVRNTSRAIIYTGSVAGTTGIGVADPGYPGKGNYRYNVAFQNTSRSLGSTGTYVQYREQPTLTITVPPKNKVYDGVAYDPLGWNDFSATGWQHDDDEGVNPLTGTVALNGSITTEARDVRDYSVTLGTLADTLGYKLEISGTPTLTITPRHITVGSLIVDQREYNGTTDAVVTGGRLDGVLPGDEQNVSLNGTRGQFADKNVGVDKTVEVHEASLSGSREFNYVVDFLGSSTTGTITPKALTISGVHAQDKVYDGTTIANFTGTPELSGVVETDKGKVFAPVENVTGHFADRNAGVEKPVIAFLSATELSGPEAGNYVLTGLDVTAKSATITPAILRVSGTSTSKMFDGTTDSETRPTATGLMSGDRINNLHQSFNNAMPGKGKSLVVSEGFVLDDGNNGNNYIIDADLLVRGEIKGVPMPSGLGASGFLPDSKNLDLLLPMKTSENILDRFEQADYFLFPAEEPKSSTTHSGSKPSVRSSP